eukprot:70513_1
MSKMKATVLIVISILLIASLEVHGSNRKRKLKFNYIDDDDEPPRKKEKSSASNPYDETTNTNSGKVRNQPTEKKESLLDDFLKILEEKKGDNPRGSNYSDHPHIEILDFNEQIGTDPDTLHKIAKILLQSPPENPAQNLLNAKNQELLLRNELAQHIENRKKLIDEHPQAGRTQPSIHPPQEFAEFIVHQIQNDPNQKLLNVINHELMLRNTLAQLLENQRMYPTQNMLNANNQELLLRNELAQCIKYRKKLIDDQPKAGGTLPCIDPFQELFAEISVHQIQKDPNHNLLNVINRELLLRNKLAQLKNQQK